jgi:PKD domain.
MKQKNFTLANRTKYLRFIMLIIVFSLLKITALQSQTCFETGSLLFREDFKGNNVSDPFFAPTDLSNGYSDFGFNPTYNSSIPGVYSLIKYIDYGSAYWAMDDHTYPFDRNRGYFGYFNPSANQMNSILYEKQIDNLCDGIDVLLSVWASDICHGVYAAPKFKLRISDAVTNAVLVETGDLVPPRGTSAATWKWEQYILSVPMPVGTTSIKFTVINREINGVGNDLVLDDIEIYLCTGPVNVTANMADGQTIDFTGNHTNTIFDPDIHSYWLYSTTGDVSSLTDWTPLDYKNGTCPVGSTWNHDFTLTNAQPGYYRLVVGNSDVLTSFCRAASPVLQPSPIEILDIETNPALPVCKGKEITFEAKLNTTDLTKIESIKWDFGDGTVEEDANMSTFTTKKHTYSQNGNYSVTAILKPKQQGGEVYLNSVKTINAKIASCVLPVNHNISVMGY